VKGARRGAAWAGRRAALGCVAGLSAWLCAGSVEAQVVHGGGLIQHYSFGDAQAVGIESFTLRTAPISAGATIGGSVAIDVSAAWAEGVARGPGGGEARLSGWTDTQLGFSLLLGGDRAVLTGSVAVPSGTDVLTPEEGTVAGVVASELLPFAISTWGSGGGGGGDLALAFELGDWGLGLAGGYWRAREFEPVAGESLVYRPGDQLHLRLALDRDVGPSGTLSFTVGMRTFEDDRVQELNLFRSGDRLEGMVSYAWALGARGSALAYGGVLHREEGTLLLEASPLVGATDSPSQQLFLGGASFLAPVSARVTLLPDLGLRLFRSGDGVGQGWVATAGTALELRAAGTAFGRNLVLAPSARVRVGNVLVREESDSDILGWEVGLTVRTGVGR